MTPLKAIFQSSVRCMNANSIRKDFARQQAEERAIAAERAAQERSRRADPDDGDDEEDNQPYVDRSKT